MKKNIFRRFSFLILTSFLSFILPAQAVIIKEDPDLMGEITNANVRQILEKHTENNPDLLNSSKDKDIVVFLGKTGAGKSTLINYLTDKELEVDEDGDIVLKDPLDASAMRIGTGIDSETRLPQFIQSQELLFYDFAGFGDTRSTAISLVNACFIKNIIEKAGTVRFVFVAGQGEITAGRGELFKELIMIAKDLISNKKIEEFSSVVITRSDPEKNKEDFMRLLNKKVGPAILAPWVEQKRLLEMSKPLGKNIDENDKVTILKAIRQTPAQKIESINIGVIYSHEELDTLRKIYTGEIHETTTRLIQENFNADTFSTLGIPALEEKKTYFQDRFLEDVFLSLESTLLMNLLRPLSEDIYQSSRKDRTENISLSGERIFGLIDAEIKDQELKKEQERRRQAENLRKVEENKRLQAEAAQRRIQAELVTAQKALKEKEDKKAEIEKEEKIRIRNKLPLYRWFKPGGCDHFYCTDPNGEAAPKAGYKIENIECYVYKEVLPLDSQYLVPLYRWFRPGGCDHFYCTDPNGEAAPQIGYKFEGIECYIYKSQSLEGLVPLYRWFKPGACDHFYCIDPKGEAAPQIGYKFEGMIGFVFPS